MVAEEAGTFTTEEARKRFLTLLEFRIAELGGSIVESSPATPSVEPTKYRPMDAAEARRFERTEMTFGVHAGKQIKDVPLGYLDFIDEDEFRWKLHRYLKSKRVHKERETE